MSMFEKKLQKIRAYFLYSILIIVSTSYLLYDLSLETSAQGYASIKSSLQTIEERNICCEATEEITSMLEDNIISNYESLMAIYKMQSCIDKHEAVLEADKNKRDVSVSKAHIQNTIEKLNK